MVKVQLNQRIDPEVKEMFEQLVKHLNDKQEIGKIQASEVLELAIKKLYSEKMGVK